MRRTLSVLGASLLFCLASASTALADTGSTGPLFDQTQSSSQSQTGSNSVSQNAESTAISIPLAQLNLNAPISLLSGGNTGDVEQSNDSSATSSASNESFATQGIDQSQASEQTQDGAQYAGCCTSGGGSPEFGQDQTSTQSQDAANSVDQNASSTAVSAPGPQINVNVPIRVLSPGNDGSVNQSNSSSADSSASNTSWAVQGIEQEQSSTQGQDGTQTVACGCEGGSSPYFGQNQSSDQSQDASNSVTQNAESKAISAPAAQINVNAPIRILSPGNNGDVDQSNSSSAASSASNESKAIQIVDQGQSSTQSQDGLQKVGCCDGGKGDHYGPKGKENGCGCEQQAGPVFEQVQESTQSQNADNSVTQNAESKAISKPEKQLNLNAPVTFPGHSCGCEPTRWTGKGGYGDKGGDVTQSNDSSATSSASNESTAIQVIGQGQESNQAQDGSQIVACCEHRKPGGHGKPGNHGSKGDYGKPGEYGKEYGCGCEKQPAPVFEQGQDSSQSQNGSNSVSQDAYSEAISKPGKQVNLNAPIRILDDHSCGCEPKKHSKGKGKHKGWDDRFCGCGYGPSQGNHKSAGGDVGQSNSSSADSAAANKSWAAQGVGQWQADTQLQNGLQRL